ncbi:MAG: phosphoribosylamine--glycine ligase [Candidatus Omnitrophota bacterium]|jgi:phosphoribosylamine--glycine ligase|nr:MAG: phosphoribosylamine--glycine ligase [Candidatus Omnitrophota bacterium]
MRILVIGSGGREHALVWKIAQSKSVDKIFCAPGNAGIAQQAECIDIKPDDITGLLDFARRQNVDLTVVGPEVPLSLGIADEFKKYKLNIFGPNKAAAQLESSKVFSKQMMARYQVPTAEFRVFQDLDEAKRFISVRGAPCVIKADGLAQGKGVFVAKTVEEANQAASLILRDKIFGNSGKKIIVEDCLEGPEASILVFTDSEYVIPLASSQDHKRIFDNDQGPNTGGMGAYSPAPVVDKAMFDLIMQKVIYKMVKGLLNEGIEYQGVLYAGIMITKDGPKTLEFNVRFGDPETQAILPRLKTDIVEVMLACAKKQLSKVKTLDWDNRSCVCVVCSSKGYPGAYDKGKEIKGIEEAEKIEGVKVFHAGTKFLPSTVHSPQSTCVTDGGRVLGVSGLGTTIKEAINKTYQGVSKIHFDGMHYRKDIASKAL